MIIGCYTLQLMCDHPEHKGFTSDNGSSYFIKPDGTSEYLYDEFSANTERDCRKQAVLRGWVFKRGRRVICPFCAKVAP